MRVVFDLGVGDKIKTEFLEISTLVVQLWALGSFFRQSHP